MGTTKRINRSKYNFSQLEVEGSFPIKPLDLYSMKNSLRFYNKEHGKNVVVTTEEVYNVVSKDTEIIVTRVS